MTQHEKLTIKLRPFYLVCVSLFTILTAISVILSLPKIIALIALGAIVVISLVAFGVVIQPRWFPKYGIVDLYLTRQSDEAIKFIEHSMEEAITRRNDEKKIEIDCMGIKLEPVLDALNKTVNKYDWKEVKINYLILKTGSEGAKTREIIEGRKRFELTTERALEDAKQTRAIYKKRFGDNVNFKIKTFSFLPNFFILRISEKLFVGFYLKEKGKFCPCMILQSGPDSYFFRFKNYFDSVFNSEITEEVV